MLEKPNAPVRLAVTSFISSSDKEPNMARFVKAVVGVAAAHA
jgi:hypothetical protein